MADSLPIKMKKRCITSSAAFVEHDSVYVFDQRTPILGQQQVRIVCRHLLQDWPMPSEIQLFVMHDGCDGQEVDEKDDGCADVEVLRGGIVVVAVGMLE